MSISQHIYWRLPYKAKCYAAAWNAYRLDRNRFSQVYTDLKQEISERTSWSRDQLHAYQVDRLRQLLIHSGKHVPYYRALFARIGFEPSTIQTIDALASLPLLSKDIIRSQPDAFIDERVNIKKLHRYNTSGTTGAPLTLFRDRRASAAAFAYNTVRHHAAVGVERRVNRSVSIGGHLVADPRRTRPPFWVHNIWWRQLYMSSYHLSPNNLPHYISAIREFNPEYIEGYPSSVYSIARYILEKNLAPIKMQAVFTTAENLLEYQRETIQEAFQCHAYSQYGCGEQVVYAAECSYGDMHLSMDHSIVEILNDMDQPIAPGQTGVVVGTNLENFVQPLIRYKTGDLATISERPCPCGNPSIIFSSIEGRIDAVLITRDGRRIGRLDPVFKGADGIVEAQIVQETLDDFRVRLVAGTNYQPEHGEQIRQNLLERLGGTANVSIELVPEIERTSRGKFLAVISRVPQQ